MGPKWKSTRKLQFSELGVSLVTRKVSTPTNLRNGGQSKSNIMELSVRWKYYVGCRRSKWCHYYLERRTKLTTKQTPLPRRRQRRVMSCIQSKQQADRIWWQQQSTHLVFTRLIMPTHEALLKTSTGYQNSNIQSRRRNGRDGKRRRSKLSILRLRYCACKLESRRNFAGRCNSKRSGNFRHA